MKIELDDVHKAFGRRQVLRGVSLSVKAGETYGLVGANGSGKTTAINIMCGLLEADAGTVTIAGTPPGAAGRRHLGYSGQDAALYESLTCRENLRLFGDLYGVEKARMGCRIDEIIEGFGLGGYADTKVAALSGGWRRRVDLAVSTVHGPSILLLDEPTAGLDVDARFELWQLIEERRRSGVAVLVTTHQLDEAERLCSRVGILCEGRLAAEGTMEELRAVVPAARVAEVDGHDPEAVGRSARSLGWGLRQWGDRTALLLPSSLTLAATADALADCALTSISLKEINLEHIYLETTSESSARTSVPRQCANMS
jgi:ABC-2 type transport system ATP-binding protein